MPTSTRAVEAYVGMWNATDDHERRALAEEALTEDAVLLYPTFEAQSRNEAVALAGRFHNDTPGARIEMLSGVEHHHGVRRARARFGEARRGFPGAAPGLPRPRVIPPVS